MSHIKLVCYSSEGNTKKGNKFITAQPVRPGMRENIWLFSLEVCVGVDRLWRIWSLCRNENVASLTVKVTVSWTSVCFDDRREQLNLSAKMIFSATLTSLLK